MICQSIINNNNKFYNFLIIISNQFYYYLDNCLKKTLLVNENFAKKQWVATVYVQFIDVYNTFNSKL